MEKQHFFKPRARLLLQLGDQLIKDEGLALFELVKNSYDADATYSEVNINDIDKKDLGNITIKDNGSGMNYDLITNHWLEPGTDLKEKQLLKIKRSPLYGRLPLGEKGIGRFGSHKLGQNITLFSKTDLDLEVEININWKTFANEKYLNNVPIDLKENTESQFFKSSINEIPVECYNKITSLIEKDKNPKNLIFLESIYSLDKNTFKLKKEILINVQKLNKLNKILNKYIYKGEDEAIAEIAIEDFNILLSIIKKNKNKEDQIFLESIYSLDKNTFKLKEEILSNRKTIHKLNKTLEGYAYQGTDEAIEEMSTEHFNILLSLIKKNKNKEDQIFLESIYSLDKNTFKLKEEIIDNYRIYCDLKIKLNKYEYYTSGTFIKITNIWEEWSRGMLRNTFRAVNAINSPFSAKNKDFLVTINTTHSNWLDNLLTTEEAIEQSLFIAKGSIEGNTINIDYTFNPMRNMDKLTKRVSSNNYILESTEKVLNKKTGLYKKERLEYNLDDHNIGKINFEFYMYDLSPKTLDFLQYDKVGFKKFLKNNGGIRIYRDTVRVYDYGEPGNDWLNLDYKRLTAPTLAISNNQILGAIYLDRETSKDLREKTNREGFVGNFAYELFSKAILITINKIAQERVIDKTMIKDTYGVTSKSEPVISTVKELDKYIESNIEDSNPAKKKIREKLAEIEREYLNITENLLTAAGSGLSLNIAIHEIEKIINELIKKVNEDNLDKDINDLVSNLHTTLKHYAELSKFHKNENVELKSIISSAIDLNVYRLFSHNIEIINNTVNLKNTIDIKFTKKLLLASISNLLDNSIFWLDDKEYYIRNDPTSIFHKKIYLDILIEEGIPSLIIADNGFGFKIGTDIAKRPYITKRNGSMGLGLYIIDETMKMHKGQLLFPEKGDVNLPEEFKDGAIIQLKFEKKV